MDDQESHAELDPMAASVLLLRECRRRDALVDGGNVCTGCSEIDDQVLLGGFERGCVVGVSAEDEGFGLLVGLQAVGNFLVAEGEGETMEQGRRALIISPLAMGSLLPTLRGVIRDQVDRSRRHNDNDDADVDGRLRRCLKRVSISRVFDVQGLREALEDLDKANQRPPDVILITHTNTLLNALFAARDKADAHTALQLLAAHLRYVSRSPEHGGPLVMLLNATTTTTTTTATTTTTTTSTTTTNADGSRPAAKKPPDPTLRSIFNAPSTTSVPTARRTKPAFGLIFSQMLDVHVLCTRAPRSRADAEALFAPRVGVKKNNNNNMHDDPGPRLIWVVECLLDEIGVWRLRRPGEGARPSREQRWGAVDLQGDFRLVDAFARPADT